MKHLLKFILLMGVLCIAGCSEEEEKEILQSVAFSTEEINVSPHGERVSVVIEANCPWVVTDEKNWTHTEISQGKGTTETVLVVFSNPSYEEKQYTVTVTSEDGTSSDTLIVKQGGAYGLQVGEAEPIAAEGGLVNVPVRTNDQITHIETSEWISFTESRAFTGYTYTFTADPNKTGSPRHGVIKLKGENTMTERIEVKQDSYAPTGATIGTFAEKTTESEITIPLQIVPEYADWKKLKAETESHVTLPISDGALTLNMEGYGVHTFRILAGHTELASGSSERFPEKLFSYTDEKNVYWGEKISLDFNYYSKDYSIEIKHPSILELQEDGTLLAVGTGATSVNVKHQELGLEDNIKVRCDWMRIRAEISHFTSTEDTHTVQFGAIVEFKQPAKVTSFSVTDRNFNLVLINEGVVTPQENGVKIITSPLTIPTGGVGIHEAVKEYTFHVNILMEGDDVHKSGGVHINHNRSGYIK